MKDQSKISLANRSASLANKNQSEYSTRIQARVNAAKQAQGISSELEKKEQALFERLKHTYNQEKKMVEQLQEIT